jgi:diguanylate cyclase
MVETGPGGWAPKVVAPARWWLPVLVVAAAIGATFFLLPTGSPAQSGLFVTTALGAVALVARRLVREGLWRTRPWELLLAGTGLYALATPFWGLLPTVTGRQLPFPSPLDAMYFVSYALSAAFLLSLLHQRYRGTSDADHEVAVALVDAAIVSVATMALLWPALIGPSLRDPTITGMAQVVALGYPLLTALLVGLAAAVALSGGRWTPVKGLLLLWVGAELAGDIFYGYLSATGAFFHGHPISITWLVSYAALGTLALRPKLLEVTQAGAPVALRGARFWTPLGAALAPIVMALLRDDLVLDLIAGTAVVLIVLRLRLLSGDLDAQRQLTVALRELSAQLEHASLHDPLTGLANRALFSARLEQGWELARRHERPLAVLVVDLDGFKAINDHHGHHVGDRVLVEGAGRMQVAVRASDTLARTGGDEFALVLPEATTADALRIADRIRGELSRPLDLDGPPVAVAASIGVATADPRQRTAADLLREADAAMYAAKAAGPGRIETYAVGIERTGEVVLADVAAPEAAAWAGYVRELRDEIADRKREGQLPSAIRAPSTLHRTLEQVLDAIDRLQDGPGTSLTLPSRNEVEEFVYHHTAVQHWADSLHADGSLTTSRPAAADRFWGRLEQETELTASAAIPPRR